MRTRIALVAAVAGCIAFSTAAAGAVALTAKSLKAEAGHGGYKERKSAPDAGRLAAQRSPSSRPSSRSLAVVESIERRAARQWGLLLAPPHPSAPPGAAAASAAQAPTSLSPTSGPAPTAPMLQQVDMSDPSTDSTSTTTPDWGCIREHESGGDYSENSGNGYSGAYQFLPSTWNEAVTSAGYPQYANGEAYEAPPAVQNAAALWLYNSDGWEPWSTRYVCGL